MNDDEVVKEAKELLIGEPEFEDQYCQDCPFLVPHPTDPYGIFRCKKYDVELDYYDGVLQAEKCYQEYVDPSWVIAGE